MTTWMTALVALSVIGNLAGAAWSFYQSSRHHRAANVFRALCFMAWPMRHDRRLAQHYLNTLGRSYLSGHK